MALKECPECGGRMSTTASTCPHCGARNQVEVLKIVAGVLIGVIILVVLPFVLFMSLLGSACRQIGL